MTNTAVFLEYVWLGGNSELRSKTKVFYLDSKKKSDGITLNDLPNWNYDGSSTGQAEGIDSEVILKPRALFNDPIRGGIHKLVMCDTYDKHDKPLPNNFRFTANNLFNKALDQVPWFGLEQEYFIINPLNQKPLGYNSTIPQGQFYCSVGQGNAFGREIVEEHLVACTEAGINISGVNAEVAPGQWEFQVGPCTGIEAGDHLWMARYLLVKIAEKHNMGIDFEPKVLKGNWNGSGCHTNYSTKKMRNGDDTRDGLYYILEAIDKLREKHAEHMRVYGEHNDQRMTGEHETSSYETFSFDITKTVNRGASIRVGNETLDARKGYFEDRRPSSNCDPYLVTSKIFETTVLQ